MTERLAVTLDLKPALHQETDLKQQAAEVTHIRKVRGERSAGERVLHCPPVRWGRVTPAEQVFGHEDRLMVPMPPLTKGHDSMNSGRESLLCL